MPGIEPIELWLDKRKLAAVRRSLEERASSVEQRMEEFFQALYDEMVPLPVQKEIDEQIYADKLRMAAEVPARMKQTAYRVAGDGRQDHFRSDTGSDILITALRLRRHLSAPTAGGFETLLSDRIPISEKEFETLAMRCLEDAPQIAGVFDLDFDRLEFSFVDPEAGWQTFPMSAVCSALGRVENKQGLSHEQNRALLTKNLEGWVIPSPGHLSIDAIVFEGKIHALPGRLEFQLDPEAWFDSLDAVFGTNTLTTDNDDFLAVFACYDPVKREVCGELEVEVCHGLESTEKRRYLLSGVEQACVGRKMEAYCRQQTGMGLVEYSAKLQQGYSMPPPKPLGEFELMELYAGMCVAEMADKILGSLHHPGPLPEAALSDHGCEDGSTPKPEDFSAGPVMGGM